MRSCALEGSFYVPASLPFVVLLLIAPQGLRFWLGARFSLELVPAFRIMLMGTLVTHLGGLACSYLLAVANVGAYFASHVGHTGEAFLL